VPNFREKPMIMGKGSLLQVRVAGTGVELNTWRVQKLLIFY